MRSKLIQPRSFRVSPFSNEYLRCPSVTIRRSTVVDLFVAEYTLRLLAQRREVLLFKLTELQLQQEVTIESNESEIQEVTTQLQENQSQLSKGESALLRAEFYLGNVRLKVAYDELRKDAKWFMRQEMVDDCWSWGGCCSRECGCCAKRYLLDKGAGHCTSECWCCNNSQGSGPPEIREEVDQSLRSRLEDQHPVHVVNIANWFFTPQTFQEDPRRISEPEDLLRLILDFKPNRKGVQKLMEFILV